MLYRCFLDFPVCVGAFVIGLSQISSFFSEKFRLKIIFKLYRISRNYTQR